MIDVFDLSRNKGRLTGEIPVHELPRLAEECVDQLGSIVWSLEGAGEKLGHPLLILSVSSTVQLVCQRCLTSLPFKIKSDTTLVLAKDEEEADEVEKLLADEDVEVIVGSKTFNPVDLIEDEALLAIPSSVKHESCLNDLGQETVNDSENISPFAVLKGLKH